MSGTDRGSFGTPGQRPAPRRPVSCSSCAPQSTCARYRLWIGDAEAVLIEIEAFLIGVRRSRRDRPPSGPEALTRREREVAALAVQGLSAHDIGGAWSSSAESAV